MIVYATKETREKFGLPDDLQPDGEDVSAFARLEVGDPLQEWGMKVFYFDRRKCLQVCNFASKFTIFLFYLKKKDVDLIGEMLGYYIYELYSDDVEMRDAIEDLFGLKPTVYFSKLTNRRTIATLNTTQRIFAMDGENFYQFVKDGELDTMELNQCVNFEYLITDKINGKTEYFFPGRRFRELVLEAYRGRE